MIAEKIKSIYRESSLSSLLFMSGCMILMGGLWGLRALQSIGPAIMFLSVIIHPELRSKLKKWITPNFSWIFFLFYLLLLISWFYTEDKSRWNELLVRKLPLLILPFSFFIIPLNEKQKKVLLTFFVSGVLLIAALTYIHYLLNKSYLDAMIANSKNIPVITKIFHIHFAMMMAISSIIAYFQWRDPLKKSSALARNFFGIASLLLFILLHLLAYRTGLFMVYALVFINIIWLIFKKKKILQGGLLLCILIAAPITAYYSLNSVKLRVENTLTDINRFREKKDINFYSISQRLAAWETAYQIIKQHPLIGVGQADLELEMERQYDKNDFGLYPSNRVLIHNQFLHTLVTLGITGFLLFFFLLIYPFTIPSFRADDIAPQVLIALMVAMIVDSYMELQAGLNLFLFFYCFLVQKTSDGKFESKFE